MLLAPLLIGCLGTTWRVPREELDRLAEQPGPSRGDAVRVVQDLKGAPVPARSGPRIDPPEEREPPPDVVVMRPWGLWVDIAIQAPLPPGPHLLLPGPPPFPPPPPPPPVPDVPSGAGAALEEVDDARVLAALAVLAAAGVLVVVGVTEGVRFDGWVGVDPAQPLHLRSGDQWRTVLVRDLRPEDLADVDFAVLRPDEGDVQELSRAPLSREGLTYRVELGAAESPDADWARSAHILGGYHPNRWVGVLGGAQVLLDADEVRTRWGIEAQALPMSGGRLHLGGFGGGGWERAVTAGGIEGAPFVAAGILGEVELVTRVGVTARVGWAADPTAFEPRPFGAIGFAVY